MADSWASAQARELCLYTGQKYQQALDERQRHGRSSAVIAGALGEQATMESLLMHNLCTGGEYWQHLLGVSAVHPRPDRITVDLDQYTVLSTGRTYPMSHHVLQVLLPKFGDGQITGIPGLRVTQLDTGPELALSRPDGSAQLVLRGHVGTDWHAAEDEAVRLCEETGGRPLWRLPELTRHEQRDSGTFRPAHLGSNGVAWLGSGLLRRIALFHRGYVHSVSSWTSDRRWHLQLATSSAVGDHPARHKEFLEWLQDPAYGLALRPDDLRSHCSCGLAQGRIPHDIDCTYEFTHRDEHLGGRLVVTFRQRIGKTEDIEQSLVAVGADPAWLERVLPPMSSARLPGQTLTADAEALSSYTGVKAETARKLIRLQPSRTIPTAGVGQAMLESQLFEELVTTRAGQQHWLPGDPAFGINKVTGTGSELTLHLQPEYLPEIIRLCLPWQLNGDVRGIPGLRPYVHKTGLSLYQLGAPGEIHLIGPSSRQWHAAHVIATETIRQAAPSAQPLWHNTPDQLDPAERNAIKERDENQPASALEQQQSWAQMLSNVLRRIRILDQLAEPQGLDMWTGRLGRGPALHIECDSRAMIDALAKALLDDSLGIAGLRQTESDYPETRINLRHRGGAAVCLRVAPIALWDEQRRERILSAQALRRQRLAELANSRGNGRS